MFRRPEQKTHTNRGRPRRSAAIPGRYSAVSRWFAGRNPTVRAKRSIKFTLIELLVVVAIIGILASMLLPVLTKAKESGRRAVCISNQKQVYVAFYMYYDEQDGKLPISGSKGWNNNWRSGDYVSTFYWQSHEGLTDSGNGRPGWSLMFVNDYLPMKTFSNGYGSAPNSIMFCPSQDQSVTRFQHYGYRYNNVDTKGSGSYKTAMDGHADRAFMTDAATRRHFVDGKLYPRTVYYHGGYGWAPRWGHMEGGNVIRHDGSGRWLRNRLDLRWPSTYFLGDYPKIDQALAED